jgi:hypothetical protein
MGLQQIGKGMVVGLAGADDFYSTKVIYQSAEETDDFQKKYIQGATGDTVGGYGYDGKRNISVDMIVAADTIAHAESSLKKPGKMATVTLSAFKDATINGAWIYEGGCKIRYLNTDIAKITLPLVKFDADISTAVNA